MAHIEQQEFFQRLQLCHPSYFSEAVRVLEVGSQNINGTVRSFFTNAQEYLGIDLGIADCVDWVIPGELIELPDGWADVVISTECFEHCKNWDKVFTNMIRILKPGGFAVITCATHGRATHGTIDSEELSSPFTTSYYKNLGVDDIASKIALGLYFSSHGFEVNSLSSDLYFWGIRAESDIQVSNYYWEDPMSRLARAQGQLGQAAARHAAMQSQLENLEIEARQAKAEAEQTKAEAEQTRAEAERTKGEAERIRAEIEQARSEAERQQRRTILERLKKMFRYSYVKYNESSSEAHRRR